MREAGAGRPGSEGIHVVLGAGEPGRVEGGGD